MKRHCRISKILAFLFISIAACFAARPVFAGGGGHLWFYSQDPGNPPLPDPMTWDPLYVGVNSDPWLSESIVIPSGDWETPFHIYLACAQFESLNTKLVVSLNDAAYGAIDTIKINGTTLTGWDTTGNPPANIAPHGVFNSAEFYGYALADLIDLYSPPGEPFKVAIRVEITLKDGIPADAKIHFDAYGYTDSGEFIFSPYSHDSNFVVPEPATILATTASILALGFYVYKRRK